MASNAAPFTRRYIPFLGDVLAISSPSHIRRVAAHPDIARLDVGTLPVGLRYMLEASQLFSPTLRVGGPDFSLSFSSPQRTDIVSRRARTEQNLASHFSEESIAKVADLVTGKKTGRELGRAIIRILGPTIAGCTEGQPLPEDVVEALAPLEVKDLVNPFQNYAGRRSCRVLERWVKEAFPHVEHHIDIIHDLVTGYQGLRGIVLGLREMRVSKGDFESYFANHPPLGSVFRKPLRDTTVDALFDKPLTNNTVIILNIGEAAKSSGDFSFVFSVGLDERVCPFRDTVVRLGQQLLEKSAIAVDQSE